MAIENIETLDPTLDTPEVMAPEMSEEILAADPVAEEPVEEEVEVAGLGGKISNFVSEGIANVIQKPVGNETDELKKPARKLGKAEQ